jgi:cytosine permease
VGVGTLVSIALAVTGLTGKVVEVFVVIGASFGPVCGAMLADYLLSCGKWAGPRAGFNPAGWISWVVGFIVGAFQFIAPLIPAVEFYKDVVPCPPVAAFVVGFLLYFVLAKLGLQSKTLTMPGAAEG